MLICKVAFKMVLYKQPTVKSRVNVIPYDKLAYSGNINHVLGLSPGFDAFRDLAIQLLIVIKMLQYSVNAAA